MENKFQKRKNLIYLLLIICFSCTGTVQNDNQRGQSAPDAYPGLEDFNIKRGTNISHWLSQSNRRGTERENFFQSNDMDLIAELGYDHIRLPVDEEQLWDEQGNKEKEAFQLLHHGIEWALENDLKVIVDLHILRSHHFNEDDKPLWTSDEEQQKFIALWIQLSDELKQYPKDKVAYELMNEPVADDHNDWNQLVEKAVRAIRLKEPSRKIVIGSNMWQSVDTFQFLEIPENDEHIILSFHFYEPFLLTHYRTSWTYLFPYEGNVRYPGLLTDPEEIAQYPTEVAERISHHNQVFNRDSLADLIRKPLNFAKDHNLPVYCGEWGCYTSVDQDSRMAWYADVRSILEEFRIPWTHWDYKGGFGIINNETGEKNEELIDVLLN